MATPTGSEIASVLEQRSKVLQREGGRIGDTVTLDEMMAHHNKKHSTLGDGLERAEYEVSGLGGEMVSLDDVMLHQNRILHNEDGFRPEDYRM